MNYEFAFSLMLIRRPGRPNITRNQAKDFSPPRTGLVYDVATGLLEVVVPAAPIRDAKAA